VPVGEDPQEELRKAALRQREIAHGLRERLAEEQQERVRRMTVEEVREAAERVRQKRLWAHRLWSPAEEGPRRR